MDPKAPEMNEVERIYRLRDERIERGEIHIILPEEEHRKHQKDGTFPGPAAPTNEFEAPYDIANTSNIGGGHEPRAPGHHVTTHDPTPHEIAGNDHVLLVPDDKETDRFCICGKQNDN